MDLNGGIHALYSSTQLVYNYKQNFNYNQGLFTDSAYINHIVEFQDKIIITIPEQIDIISNIKVYGGKYIVSSANNIITDGIINIHKYNCVKIIIYDIHDYANLTISYDVYLFKKQLKSLL